MIVITNQSGTGLGYFTEADYHAVHNEMVRQLAPAPIDAAYFSSGTPDNAGPRRKPNPGMVLEAARDFGIDLTRSYFAGDRAGGIECGRNAGTRTVMVETGYGSRFPGYPAGYRAKTLAEAADWILEDAK